MLVQPEGSRDHCFAPECIVTAILEVGSHYKNPILHGRVVSPQLFELRQPRPIFLYICMPPISSFTKSPNATPCMHFGSFAPGLTRIESSSSSIRNGPIYCDSAAVVPALGLWSGLYNLRQRFCSAPFHCATWAIADSSH